MAVFRVFAAVFRDFAADFRELEVAVLVLDVAFRAVVLRAALPRGVFAPAVRRPVFRLAEAVRFAPAPLRLADRAPAPAFFREGVRFRPDFFAVFFAMSRLSRPASAPPSFNRFGEGGCD